MPKEKVNDINMYYEVHGDGFPLVWIMGLSANLDWWTPELIQRSSKFYKSIIFDNRDVGRSDRSEINYSIKTLANDTVGLMDALGIERAHVFGASMGGMIAQEVVLNYPERVEKLVLGCTNCGGSKQILADAKILESLNSPIEDLTPEDVITERTIPIIFPEEFIKNNPDFIESFKRRALIAPIAADSFQRQINAILGFNTYRRLKNIKSPTLVIHGKKDILIPYKNAELLAEKISGANLVLLEKAAHMFDQPDLEKAFNATYEFLKGPI